MDKKIGLTKDLNLTSERSIFSEINSLEKSRKKADRHRILEVIKSNAPIPFPELVLLVGIGETTLYDILKDFEHAELIQTKVILNSANRAVKIISIPSQVALSTKSREGLPEANTKTEYEGDNKALRPDSQEIRKGSGDSNGRS